MHLLTAPSPSLGQTGQPQPSHKPGVANRCNRGASASSEDRKIAALNEIPTPNEISPQNAALTDLALRPIARDAETERQAWGATAQLARRHGLTCYDAAYLELAQRRRLPLATLDRELRAAAAAEGISLLAA